MTNKGKQWPIFGLIAIVLLATIGCGPIRPKAYTTRGKVVFPDGSPVHVGTVELKSREHAVNARGSIENDGSFVLTTYQNGDGAIAGTHDCVVVQMVLVEDSRIRSHGTVGVVNPRFASYATSQLQCVIEPQNGNEITLTVEGIGKTTQGGSEKDHKK
jgi:hypothetical protein